jgi:hypothetical protein
MDFEKTSSECISWIAQAKERIIWQASVIMARNLAVSRLHAVSCIRATHCQVVRS